MFFSIFSWNRVFSSSFFAIYLLSIEKHFRSFLIQNWWRGSSCMGGCPGVHTVHFHSGGIWQIIRVVCIQLSLKIIKVNAILWIFNNYGVKHLEWKVHSIHFFKWYYFLYKLSSNSNKKRNFFKTMYFRFLWKILLT